MKKVNWIWIPITFGSTLLILILVRFGWKLFPEDSTFDLPTFLTAFSIVGGFIGVLWNTNRQIRNQNKESHRPYLTVVDVIKEADNFTGTKDEIKKNLNDSSFHHNHILITEESSSAKENSVNYLRKIVKLNLLIKNIGYGVLCSLDFYPIKKEVQYSQTKDGEESGNVFSTIDIEQNGLRNLDFNLNIEFEKKPNGDIISFATDAVHLLIFYKDLYDNTYCTMLIIVVDKKANVSFSCYPRGTINFAKVMKTLNGDYNNLLKEYKQNSLNDNHTTSLT